MPGALGWGHNIKWGTALMFIRMSEAIKSQFTELHAPFIIIHDPYDKVISDISVLYLKNNTSLFNCIYIKGM